MAGGLRGRPEDAGVSRAVQQPPYDLADGQCVPAGGDHGRARQADETTAGPGAGSPQVDGEQMNPTPVLLTLLAFFVALIAATFWYFPHVSTAIVASLAGAVLGLRF